MKFDSLIYGTFPDLPGSQQVVYKSEGITTAVEDKLLEFYIEFGDCKNPDFISSQSSFWLSSEKENLIVTKVTQQSEDFSGRWGALLRHSVLIPIDLILTNDFNPQIISDKLVTSGTSEELKAYNGLEIDLNDSKKFIATLRDIDFVNFSDNLKKLISGQRLELYADINSEATNLYLQKLISLLPLCLRMKINWSEFLFRSHEMFDLAICYSSRHEAPSGSKLEFIDAGKNQFADLELPDGYIDNFLSELPIALSENDNKLMELLFSMPPEEETT